MNNNSNRNNNNSNKKLTNNLNKQNSNNNSNLNNNKNNKQNNNKQNNNKQNSNNNSNLNNNKNNKQNNNKQNNNKQNNNKQNNNKGNNNKRNNNKRNNNNITKKSQLVYLLLNLLIIIKIYHWRTFSYSEHKATDKLYERLNELIDKFVEILLGKSNSRLKMAGLNINIIDPTNKNEIKQIIYQYKIILENLNEYGIPQSNTDLYNIRDELLGELNQFLYLLTLN